MNYHHYIALDWSATVMALARLTKDSAFIEEKQQPSDLKELKLYLNQFKGKKILTFEESTGSQWLYTELRDSVDEILVCDPSRNHLLKEGPKTDRIDAKKMVFLLKAGLLKAVYHSSDGFIYLRKIVSGYIDVVQAGVRWKNQRAALFKMNGLSKKEKSLERPEDNFVLKGLDQAIQAYEEEKSRYEQEFDRLTRENPVLRNLESIPGIGAISAVKIAAQVVEARRFPSKRHFWSYCGLVKHERVSGGKSYGRKSSRYCRTLKSVFKTAALATTARPGPNPFRSYYDFLRTERNYPEHQARHTTARRIASSAFAILKTGEPFNPQKFTN